MSRLEELKRQRKILDAQIKELQNNEVHVPLAKYTMSRYADCEHEIRVRAKGRPSYQHRNVVKEEKYIYKWSRIVCEETKEKMMNRLDEVIESLSRLREKLRCGTE